jgi:hypothetical protein
MATERFGIFRVTGTPTEIRQFKNAVKNRIRFDFDLLLPKLEPKFAEWGRRFIDVRYAEAGRSENFDNWGFARLESGVLLIDDDLEPAQQLAVVGHELGHFVDRYWLTPVKRRQLMALMLPNQSGWTTGAHELMAAENFAEWFQILFSDIGSLLRSYYKLRVRDAAAFKEVVRRKPVVVEPPPDDTDEPPIDEPDPLPPPPPPPPTPLEICEDEVERLNGELADRDVQIAQLREDLQKALNTIEAVRLAVEPEDIE